MDTLTHTVIGACMGEAIAGKQLGKKAMLIGALAHNIPDMDMFYNFFTTQVNALLTHRGITHSIFFNVLFSFFLAWLLKKRINNKNVSYKKWLLLIGSGLFTHIILDAFTTYGTGWFEPFDHFRVSFNILFILDPFFMFPLLIVAIALLILKRDNKRRMAWAKTGLCIASLYLGMAIFNKLYVNHFVEKTFVKNNESYKDYIAAPTPLNNFLWYIVLRSDTGYKVAYYSVFDKDGCTDSELVHLNDSLLLPYAANDEVQKLLRFSKGYYNVSRKDSMLVFSDIRFGQLGGWEKKNTPFVFNFDIVQKPSGPPDIHQSEFASFQSGVFGKLYKRIEGLDCN